MTYTEDEARKKWCPFARVVECDLEGEVLEPIAVGNRSTVNTAHPKARCMASACMAWRWSDEPREVGTDQQCDECGGQGVLGSDECPHCVSGYLIEGVLVGYCGLAGEPS